MADLSPISYQEAFFRFQKGIARALRGHDETPEYLAERCREKFALCFSDGSDLVIVELKPIRTTGKFSLLIWCAVSSTNDGGYQARVVPLLEKIATDLGAVRLEFCTNRYRAAELVMGPGWNISHVVYEREVRP